MKPSKDSLFAKLEAMGIDTKHIVGNVQAHGGRNGALLTWECQKYIGPDEVEHLLGIRYDKETP